MHCLTYVITTVCIKWQVKRNAAQMSIRSLKLRTITIFLTSIYLLMMLFVVFISSMGSAHNEFTYVDMHFFIVNV